jgi:hypothetical protein
MVDHDEGILTKALARNLFGKPEPQPRSADQRAVEEHLLFLLRKLGRRERDKVYFLAYALAFSRIKARLLARRQPLPDNVIPLFPRRDG